MRKIILICLALLCMLTLTACAPEASEPEHGGVGTWTGSAPNFTVLNADGKAVQLAHFAGKPIVINFWATWCGYCKIEMPDFDTACKAYPDVVFLMINATDGIYETKQKADAYVAEQGFTFDVYYDVAGSAQAAYNVSGYPTTVFINAQGDVVSKEVGAISYQTLLDGIAMISRTGVEPSWF